MQQDSFFAHKTIQRLDHRIPKMHGAHHTVHVMDRQEAVNDTAKVLLVNSEFPQGFLKARRNQEFWSTGFFLNLERNQRITRITGNNSSNDMHQKEFSQTGVIELPIWGGSNKQQMYSDVEGFPF